MKKPVRPSATTRIAALTRTSSPSKKSVDAPSVSGGQLSGWARVLSSDCQVNKEREEPSVSGRSQTLGGGASLCCNIIHQTPPTTRPRPSLPVSSMFESGEEFSFDEFLTADKF